MVDFSSQRTVGFGEGNNPEILKNMGNPKRTKASLFLHRHAPPKENR